MRKVDRTPTGKELDEFAAKVAKLRAEGLSTEAIVARLGISHSTFHTRMRRWRAQAKPG